MAVTFGFYNSTNGDRKYDARQLSSIFDGLVRDGIYASIGEKLVVKAGAGMIVNVSTGRAWFNHTWTLNDAPLPVTLTESDLLLPRIDAIVLEVDETVSVRANSIKALTGTPATNPVKPTLTNNVDLHQYPLAYITVPDGATEIIQDNIENMIGTSSTPFVTGLLETTNIDNLLLQWDAQFRTWFNDTKNTLTEDAAGNLLNKINDVSPYVGKPYHATFTTSGWNFDSAKNWWWQTQILYDENGTALSEVNNAKIGSAVKVDQTDNLETNQALSVVANLINKGLTLLVEGNKICCHVGEQPVTDIVAYWDLRGV